MSSRKQHGSKAISSDPLAFRPGTIDLTFEEFALDGDDEFFELERDGRTVSLVEWEGGWHSLTLRGEATIETDLVDEVFPEDERDDPPGKLVLATDCVPTYLREGHDSNIEIFSEGTYPVELTVNSADYYRSFSVTPQLVRTSQREDGPSSTYRTLPGLVLADGESVTVEIDTTVEGAERLLPSFFKSFRKSESDRFPDDAVYVVDKEDLSRPKLFVNSDHEPIRDALNSGPRGYIGHVMMVYRDQIFLPALTELILWTAEDVDESGTTPHDWQEALLETIATRMYDVNGATEAGRRLYEEFHEEEAMTTLLDRTSRTLQAYLNIDESMNSLVTTLR